jgi:hypothetical protein
MITGSIADRHKRVMPMPKKAVFDGNNDMLRQVS